MGAGLMGDALQATSRQGTFDAAALARYRAAWLRPGARSGMLAWYRAMLRYPSAPPEDLTVDVPTHIIWGRRDTFLGAALAERSLTLCRSGQLTFIDRATHWVQHEAADEVSALLIDWFSRPDQAA